MLRPELMKIIKELKFEYPSEVQRLGIVEILQGKNLICQAKSGTGKTAVFVISILQLLEADEYGYYLPHQCFVMVPTRELAHQILKEFLQFSKYIRPKISISAFFGGVPI
jgi:ATP-dependent RNA helicase UAP56/SUB2